jgi:hypothetical protein
LGEAYIIRSSKLGSDHADAGDVHYRPPQIKRLDHGDARSCACSRGNAALLERARHQRAVGDDAARRHGCRERRALLPRLPPPFNEGTLTIIGFSTGIARQSIAPA